MKDKLFHFFGNIIEQSSIPTIVKLKIAFRLDLILYFIANFSSKVLRKPGEFRISKEFVNYLSKNNLNKNSKKIDLLKINLDHESNVLIEKIIERQRHVYTNNILDLNLLTNKERKLQKINFYNAKKKFKDFGNYYGIENFYFHSGLRFIKKDFLKKHSKKDVIDAGAANGDTALIFSKEYKFRNIYAFEPETNNHNKLVENIKKFKLDNVVAIKKGVGNKNEKLKIVNQEGQSYISLNGTQQITITTIDKFVYTNKLDVGMIKMDVEGFEYLAIQGSLKTIKESHPLLLISIYHNGKDFFEIKPLLEKIGGYRFIIRKLNPHHFFFDTMLIAIPTEV